MKLDSNKTSSRRKMRKAHFGADSTERRKRMASMLAPNLKQQYKVKSLPVVKGDEVKVMRGSDKTKGKEGKVTAVYRRKYVIHVERCTREKSNKQVVPIGIDASKVMITKLKMDKGRRQILTRKKRSVGGAANTDNLAGVD